MSQSFFIFQCKFIVKKTGLHFSICTSILHFNWCGPAGKVESISRIAPAFFLSFYIGRYVLSFRFLIRKVFCKRSTVPKFKGVVDLLSVTII